MTKELEEGYLNNISGIYDFDTCFDPDDNELETFEQKFSRKVKREPNKIQFICKVISSIILIEF